jgi:Sporulation and spore germination
VIPRYQKILFTVLLVAALAMGAGLWHLRQRAHARLLAGEDSAPTRAPEVAPAEQATLVVANDTDGSLLVQERSLPLPSDPGARARIVLGKLLDVYADQGAAHPVSGGAAGISEVFLLPAPDPRVHQNANAELAVVNLTGNFVASHPSGLETETLTVLSICATLRANLPQISEVRFLVDGRLRANLAGHADLTRTYLTADAVPTGGTNP